MGTSDEIHVKIIVENREYSVTVGKYGMTVLRLRENTGALLQHATQWIDGGFASTPDWLPADLCEELAGRLYRVLPPR